MNYKKENYCYYNNTKSLYGEGDPRVLWKRKECQEKRFERQANLFDYTGKSVLDVGCGYGDFYFYLLENSMKPKAYIGIDLIQSHCKIARRHLPEHTTIINGDFLEVQIPEVDIAVLSGALNVHFEKWKETALAIIDKMWNLSNEAITFNIRSSHQLSGEYKGKSQQIQDINPAYWCEYAHNKTSKYGLYHDYVPYDYTIAMWKVQKGW